MQFSRLHLLPTGAPVIDPRRKAGVSFYALGLNALPL